MSQKETKQLHIEVECPVCYGEGFLEVGPSCTRPASMCCGGCYDKTECTHDLCDNGYITITLDEEETIEVVKHLIQNQIDEARDIVEEQHPEVCQR